MVRRLIYALILCVILFAGAVMAQSTHVWHPSGTLFMRADGAKYLVGNGDKGGQWQVAWGNPQKWVLLKKANPQLANPDSLMPGFQLNIPPELVSDFVNALSPNAVHTESSSPPITSIGSPKPAPVEAESHGNLGTWFLIVLLLAAVVAALLLRGKLHRERKERHEAAVLAQAEARQLEREREMADPYAGPSVVEGGLPTPESALEHFGRSYQEERSRMTVAQSAQLPARVSVTRIVPVWVWGEMGVREGGRSTPVRKVLEQREPAWRAYLSDGSSRITLWRCGNDVYAGNGYDILPETQIEERTDLPSYTPTVPQRVWPESTPSNVPAEIPTQIVPLQFANARFDGPQRLVLHPGGLVLDFGPLVAQGVRISVGVQNGEVIVDNNGQRVVFGRIVGEQPAQSVPVALLAGTSTETSRQIEEVLAHVPADDPLLAVRQEIAETPIVAVDPAVTEAPTSVPGSNS